MRSLQRTVLFLACGLCLTGATSCRPDTDARSRTALDTSLYRVTNSVTVVIEADAETVRFERDLFVSVTVKTAAERDVLLPPARSFISGFDVVREFDAPVSLQDGTATHRHRLQLRPRAARDYRLGPVTIPIRDMSYYPASNLSVHIPALHWPLNPPVTPPPSDIAVQFDPIPPPRPMSPAAGLLLLAVVLLLAILPAAYLRRIRQRALAPRRAISRETALVELHALMARGLPNPGTVEEFYHALTGIVRRHIEATHAIMAPEQTTEELLDHAAHDPRLTPAFVELLRRFFYDADVVKFAAGRPPDQSINAELARARELIEEQRREETAS